MTRGPTVRFSTIYVEIALATPRSSAPSGARSRWTVFQWTMKAVMRLRPATMWVAALIFALARSVVSLPRPDWPLPALLAPT
jgi:hypothetical protein